MVPIISERLIEARKQKNITQEQLAKNSYCSKQVISNIERGVTKSVNEYVLNLLAFSLSVTADYLTGAAESPNTMSNGKTRVISILPEWDYVSDMKNVLEKHSNTRDIEVLLRDIVYFLSQSNKITSLEENASIKLLQNVIDILNTADYKDIKLLVQITQAFKDNHEK